MYRSIDQNRVSFHIYGQLIFNKDVKTIPWGKDSFQQMVMERLDIPPHTKGRRLLPHTIDRDQLKNINAQELKL